MRVGCFGGGPEKWLHSRTKLPRVGFNLVSSGEVTTSRLQVLFALSAPSENFNSMAWRATKALCHWVVITSAHCQLKSEKPAVPLWLAFCFCVFSFSRFLPSMPFGFNLCTHPAWIPKNNSTLKIWHLFWFLCEAVSVCAGTWNVTSARFLVRITLKNKWEWQGQQKLTKNCNSSFLFLFAPLVPQVGKLLPLLKLAQTMFFR